MTPGITRAKGDVPLYEIQNMIRARICKLYTFIVSFGYDYERFRFSIDAVREISGLLSYTQSALVPTAFARRR